MLIKSITLNNFRQFKGTQILTFATDPEKNVTVLLGDNTFGKTTILQAFNWCLYGVADFPKDSNPDFLLNYEVASEQAGIEKKCKVYVEVILEHKNMEYRILRELPYVDRGYDKWAPLSQKLTVSYKEDGITKFVREGEEQSVINGILPQSLSVYFFFDTERVSDIGNRKDLSDAVQGLLGLSAVSNAKKHLGTRTQKSTVIGQWNLSLDSESNDRAQESMNIISEKRAEEAKLKHEIEEANEQLIFLNAEKERIAEILRENTDTADLQRRKQSLETDLEEEQSELKDSNQVFLDNYNNDIVTYFMLPLMNQAEACLKDANVDDKGIRDMTESSINDIIKRGRCICGAKIEVDDDGKTGNDAYMHILEELKFLPPENIGSAIQNYKQLLDTDRRNITQFYPTIYQQYKEIQRHRSNIAVMEDEISKIDENILGKENMSSYEADMNKTKESIKRMNETIENCNREIGACESAIDSAQKTYDGLVSASERNKRLIRYIAYAEQICGWIDDNYSKNEQDMRIKLQERVNEIFNRMYHGERRVEIDKQYHVTLFANVNGKEVITGESEGLKRVKNFAFIAGLVDIAKEKATLGNNPKDSVSWENEPYPLVMDAPFSNADETHIKNISEVLPEVANQVIMFVMEKDWQYAEPVMADRVGKYCKLKKHSESYTEIQE